MTKDQTAKEFDRLVAFMTQYFPQHDLMGLKMDKTVVVMFSEN